MFEPPPLLSSDGPSSAPSRGQPQLGGAAHTNQLLFVSESQLSLRVAASCRFSVHPVLLRVQRPTRPLWSFIKQPSTAQVILTMGGQNLRLEPRSCFTSVAAFLLHLKRQNSKLAPLKILLMERHTVQKNSQTWLKSFYGRAIFRRMDIEVYRLSVMETLFFLTKE